MLSTVCASGGATVKSLCRRVCANVPHALVVADACSPGATYGKPVRQGVNHLKFQRSLRSTAEERVGRRCGNLRVLNSYWINQDGVYKYFEVILVDPSHKAVRFCIILFTSMLSVGCRSGATPVSTGSQSRCTNAAMLVDSPVPANRSDSGILFKITLAHTFHYAEPRTGQGSPPQPHASPLNLEEAQHSQPSSLPLIPQLPSCYIHFCPFLYGCVLTALMKTMRRAVTSWIPF